MKLKMEKRYYTKKFKTVVGELTLIGSQNGLYSILWENEDSKRVRLPKDLEVNDNYPLFQQLEMELNEYFSGKITDFTIPLDLSYGTDFQRSAWKALTEIPFGEIRTYAQQAVVLKNPKAVRAVGSANGKNPLSIVVPCHRVISINGKLGGFAGGLEVKQFLIDLEEKYK
jgi:methylated-DNA-[protein]-cysteine S-methyltransferase